MRFVRYYYTNEAAAARSSRDTLTIGLAMRHYVRGLLRIMGLDESEHHVIERIRILLH